MLGEEILEHVKVPLREWGVQVDRVQMKKIDLVDQNMIRAMYDFSLIFISHFVSQLYNKNQSRDVFLSKEQRKLGVMKIVPASIIHISHAHYPFQGQRS